MSDEGARGARGPGDPAAAEARRRDPARIAALKDIVRFDRESHTGRDAAKELAALGIAV